MGASRPLGGQPQRLRSQGGDHPFPGRDRRLRPVEGVQVRGHLAQRPAVGLRRSILRQLASQPDWTFACGTFDLPVSKATSTHHFAVLRKAGLLEQRDEGTRRPNRLRREDFDRRFPGLLDLVLRTDPSAAAGDHPGAGLA